MSLVKKATLGAMWSVLSGVGARAVGLVSTLVLTRFVPPREYGAVSVASVIVNTASAFTGLGLFHYVVATPNCERSKVFHASTIYLVLGVIALAVVVWLRHLWGPIFNSSLAAAYIPGMALAAVGDRLSFPAERIMIRDMQFGRLALARGVTEVAYAISAIGFAVAGFGGMSIVYGNIVQWWSFAIMLVVMTNWRDWIEPTRPSWRDTRTLLRFGLPMAAAELSHEASRTWDNLLVSRFFGEATCGRYNLAYNLADIPATHIGEQVGDVLLPSYARLPEDGRAWGLIRSTRLLAVVVFPLAMGLSAVAHTATLTIFDARWESMAPMLMILASLSVVRPIGWAINSYLIAQRRPVTASAMEVFKLGILLALIIALSRYGVLWTCVAVGVAFFVNMLFGLVAVRIKDGVSLLELGGSVLPTLLACVPMYAAVYGVRYLFSMGAIGPNALTLASEITVGAIVYVPSVFLISPTAARDLFAVGKRAVLGGDDDDDDDEDDDDE